MRVAAMNQSLRRCSALLLLVGAVVAQVLDDPWVLRARILATLEKRIALAEQTEHLLRQNFESIQFLQKDGRVSDLDVARAAIARFEAEEHTLKLRVEHADSQARYGRTIDEKAVDGFLAQQL